VLAFLTVGLTQPRFTSLWLSPLAAAVWWRVSELPTEQGLVRIALAMAVWISVAELPAWLAHRLRSTQRELARLASTDPLTGLANRRTWQRNLEALPERTPLAVLLIDVDHFKRYNDEHGHLAGDALLVRLAERLQRVVRDGDVVARWGGEEFALALPTATETDAHRVAERVLTAVPLGQSCSIGLAARRPGETVGTLMARADAALYRAKSDGRNRVVAA